MENICLHRSPAADNGAKPGEDKWVSMEPLTERQLTALKTGLVSLGRDCVAKCDAETERLSSAMSAEGRSDSDQHAEEARVLLEAYTALLHQLARHIQANGGTPENTGDLFPAVALSVANQLTGPRRPRLYRFQGLAAFRQYMEVNAWVSDLESKLQREREKVENEFRNGRAF